MAKDRPAKFDKERQPSEFDERVVEISRVSRVVKGGRRIRFRILVVIGDRKGKIGYGIAKATEIAVGVKKAVSQAKKHMIAVPVINDTIPYPINYELGSAKIFLGPASQGTSIVAGGVVRTVAELAGVKNMLSKVIGTSNKINNVKAMFGAFSSFEQEKIEIIKKRYASVAPEKVEIPLPEIKEEKAEAKVEKPAPAKEKKVKETAKK
ncbi:MAG: 30S ribosomal protein S5 [Patescibacteria group bacterium]|jgi:small subunit ribosomal protein S5